MKILPKPLANAYVDIGGSTHGCLLQRIGPGWHAVRLAGGLEGHGRRWLGWLVDSTALGAGCWSLRLIILIRFWRLAVLVDPILQPSLLISAPV
ncbi:MAG: hypothetical protein VKO65_09265 [Cyanobacteriota bacterium]|nr:hypothetical protein [Cyanobacteriota bacterium]